MTIITIFNLGLSYYIMFWWIYRWSSELFRSMNLRTSLHKIIRPIISLIIIKLLSGSSMRINSRHIILILILKSLIKISIHNNRLLYSPNIFTICTNFILWFFFINIWIENLFTLLFFHYYCVVFCGKLF